MFEKFLRAFPANLDGKLLEINYVPRSSEEGMEEVHRLLGGNSFGGGLYRGISVADLDVWHQRVTLAFPSFAGRITCFGYDWLGSIFAVDEARLVDGLPGVIMFEPGTGEALEIPSNILTFHDEGLTQFAEAAFAISFFRTWLAKGGKRPQQDECIGYRKPLFLGGSDEVENLELCDVDVYWHISGQLIRKVRGLS